MDLSGRTFLVAMGELEWLVTAELKHAGARALLADNLADARQMLHAAETGLDAIVLGLRLRDGFSGSLIREARSGTHPCATVACVTDPANEEFLVGAALSEGPRALVWLPDEANRLVGAIESTVKRTEVLRGWARTSAAESMALALDEDASVATRSPERQAIEAAQALAAPEQLSPDEINVVRELIAGYRAVEIATRSGKSAETVRSQLKAVRSKLHARSTVHLLALINGRALGVQEAVPVLSCRHPTRPNNSHKVLKSG